MSPPPETVTKLVFSRLTLRQLAGAALVCTAWRVLVNEQLALCTALDLAQMGPWRHTTVAQVPALLRRLPGLRRLDVRCSSDQFIASHDCVMAILAALPRSIEAVYFTNWFVADVMHAVDPALLPSTRGRLRMLARRHGPYRADTLAPAPHAPPPPAAVTEGVAEAEPARTRALGTLDAVFESLVRAAQRMHSLARASDGLQAFVLPPLFPPDDPLMSALLQDESVADRVANDAFLVLRAVPTLTLFEADAVALCPRRAAALAALMAGRATPMRALLLRGQEALTDTQLVALAAACPQLEVLELSCSGITPSGVAALLRACPRLRTLSLSHSAQLEGPQLLEELLPALRDDAPALRALDFSGCTLSTPFVHALPAALGSKVHGLGLGDVPGMCDALLLSLRTHCTQLRALDVTAADDRVSPEALAAIFAQARMLALTAIRSDAIWSDSDDDEPDDDVSHDSSVAEDEDEADSLSGRAEAAQQRVRVADGPAAGSGSSGRSRSMRVPIMQKMPRHALSSFDDWFTRSMLLAPRP